MQSPVALCNLDVLKKQMSKNERLIYLFVFD
ncbi:vitamin B6 biosynthesis protein [Trichinella spiralis]|nr:vitamin B6 biosynthesis protein [Trichinella spiralis]